jgi:hypothetical protein
METMEEQHAYSEGVLDDGCARWECHHEDEEDDSIVGCQRKAPALHGMQLRPGHFAALYYTFESEYI